MSQFAPRALFNFKFKHKLRRRPRPRAGPAGPAGAPLKEPFKFKFRRIWGPGPRAGAYPLLSREPCVTVPFCKCRSKLAGARGRGLTQAGTLLLLKLEASFDRPRQAIRRLAESLSGRGSLWLTEGLRLAPH